MVPAWSEAECGDRVNNNPGLRGAPSGLGIKPGLDPRRLRAFAPELHALVQPERAIDALRPSQGMAVKSRIL
jgi:hypothetical protein